MPLPLLLTLLQDSAPRIHYLVEASPRDWKVTVTGSGLDPAAGPLEFRLDEWGEWRILDSLYFRLIECAPALAEEAEPLPPLICAEPPADGTFRLVYELRTTRLGSQAHAGHGLLPFRAPTYSYGHTANVFVEARQAGAPVAAQHEVELVPPEGWEVVSGWAGRTVGAQRAPFDPTMGNGIFAFGLPAFTRSFGTEATRVDLWQFGAAKDVTETVGVTVANLAPAIAAALGAPAPAPLRVFVTDAGSGGMSSDHGLFVGHPADTPAFVEYSPYFQQTVAHELFHSWLGSRVPGDEGAAWLHEGFTDYFALWFLAATGSVDRRWFAERLLELDVEARAQSALGQVSFSDPGAPWRDGDGPLERMAYQGGCLLALALDAELRASGRPGALLMMKDFIAQGSPATAANFKAWLAAQGMTDFHARCVAGTELPPARAALEGAGFAFELASVPLCYLGLRTEGDGLGARVLAVDPSGPAAALGIRPGDVVLGYAPTREGGIEAGPEVDTPYRFGLTLLEPGAKSVQVWFERDGEEIEVRIRPEIRDGGTKLVIANAGPALDAFFQFTP